MILLKVSISIRISIQINIRMSIWINIRINIKINIRISIRIIAIVIMIIAMVIIDTNVSIVIKRSVFIITGRFSKTRPKARCEDVSSETLTVEQTC